MFATEGFEVAALHRISVGGLSLGDLPRGEFRQLTQAEVDSVFAGPSSEEVMGQETQVSGPSSSSEGPARSRVRGGGDGDGEPSVSPAARKAAEREAAAQARASAEASSSGSRSTTVTTSSGNVVEILDEDEEEVDEEDGSEEQPAKASTPSAGQRFRDSVKFKRRRDALKRAMPKSL